jgi:hypothetical protein
LLADGQDRIQGGERLLRDEGNVASEQASTLVGLHPYQVLPCEI